MTAPAECQHPSQRRMQINSVPYCLECKEYLVTGVCGTCHRAMDDHNLKDLLAPICPKSDEKVAP
jgi:hypothetical protein